MPTFDVFAAVRSVPSFEYPTLKAALTAAQNDDIIELSSSPGLYLEVPPLLLSNNLHITLRASGAKAIVTLKTPPANDEFSGRTLLSGDAVTVQAFNYAATPNTNDVSDGDRSRFGKSLWWSWIAPASGLVKVSTVGSDFPTLLAVFKGTTFPPQSLTLGVDLEWSLLNEVGFYATQGEQYPILVGGEAGASGQIVLNVNLLERPANDFFTNAFGLSGIDFKVSGTTLSASREAGEPSHASYAASNSVWFRWTAPLDGVPFPRPATLSLAGSDFDTVLAVYTGTNLNSLAPIASNDDRSLRERTSFLTFTPTPGMTYFIAVDGAPKAATIRERMGNYLLHLDYSTVNVQAQSLTSQINGSATTFQADLAIRNWGLAPTGPLQVRLVARPGEPLAGVHHAAPSTQTELGVFPLPNPGTLPPSNNKLLAVSGVCPGWFAQNDRTNIWGVFAILEEQFAGSPIAIDETFLLYGLVPEIQDPILSYGLGRPAPSPIFGSEANQVIAAGIRVSNYVTDQSTNQFNLIAQIQGGIERTVTNATWSGTPGFDLSTNGVLRVGDLAASTSLVVTGRFSLAGAWQTRTDTVPVYKRPRLASRAFTTPGTLHLDLAGDLDRPYVLETATDLSATNWQPLQTNTLTISPTTLVLPRGPETLRLYRVSFKP